MTIAPRNVRFDPKRTFQIIGRRHHVELDHSKLIAADPFFSNFSSRMRNIVSDDGRSRTHYEQRQHVCATCH
jgi:hypothetical protein